MKNKGITMISLVITIIVLTIIATISINIGSNMIKKAGLESLKTNMLLIKTKGKEYVENANFKLGPGIDSAEDKETRIGRAKEELKGTQISISSSDLSDKVDISDDTEEYTLYYELSTSDLEDMGIKNVESDNENGKYIMKYNIKEAKVEEVYNTKGYNGSYSLTDIDKIEE